LLSSIISRTSQQGSAQRMMLGLVVQTVHRIVDVRRHGLSNSLCTAAVQPPIATQVNLALTFLSLLTATMPLTLVLVSR